MNFRTFNLVEDETKFVFPELVMPSPQDNSTAPAPLLTALAFSIPRLPKMKRVKEVLNYPVGSFGGEVGNG